MSLALVPPVSSPRQLVTATEVVARDFAQVGDDFRAVLGAKEIAETLADAEAKSPEQLELLAIR